MFPLGHLGFTLLAGRLVHGALASRERFPVAFLLFGGLLPDLIDKPLAHAILGWDNGRLVAHTLVFSLALAVFAWTRSSRRLGVLALGSATHHVLDLLPWRQPSTSLWPISGGFARGFSPGGPDWFGILVGDPFVWGSEVAGLALVLALGIVPLARAGPAWWEAEPIEARVEAAANEPTRARGR